MMHSCSIQPLTSFFVGFCLVFVQNLQAQTYALGTASAPANSTITTCSGTFYDSGGASGNYTDNENYTVTFCSSVATQKMRMVFSAFSMEVGYDYLEIYDGNSATTSPLIGTFSSVSPGTVVATGQCMTMRFFSDYSIVSSGWAAAISCTATGGTAATCDDYSILVANYGNSTLTRYDNTTGIYLNTFATTTQGLNRPNFMYQLPAGDLLVSNGVGNNITKHNPYTGASLGTLTSTGLSFPEQIKLGTNGNLYLANQNGNNLKVYSIGGTELVTLTNTNITKPQGIGFNTTNTAMYVSNYVANGKINRYTVSGTGASTAITYVSTLKTYIGNNAPAGIAMKDNDLYVVVQTPSQTNPVVYGARIEKFAYDNATGTLSTTATTFATLNSGSYPYAGIVWGPDNRLYIADYLQNEVEIFNVDGTLYRKLTNATVTSLNGPHGVSFVGCSTLNTTGVVGNPSACNATDGSIDLTATGGIKLNINNLSGQPYSILWSNGATTEDISGLTSGNYYVTVTDWNGVQMLDSFTVYAPPCISGIATTCNGETTTLSVNAPAETGNSYVWSNGATTSTTNVTGGIYTVTVTSGPYSSTRSITVTNTNVTAAIAGATTTCNNANRTLTASGGGTYLWNTGEITAAVSKSPSTYTVTVTNNGCTSTSSITIVNAQGSVGNYVWHDLNKNGLNDEPVSAGINGVTVQLYSEPFAGTNFYILSQTTTTANDASGNPGYYNFDVCYNLNYYVKFPTSSSGRALTTQTTTAATNNNSDATTTTGKSPNFAINVNGTGTAKDNPTIDAGYICIPDCGTVIFNKN